MKGAYTAIEADGDAQLILIGTGGEVGFCVEAVKQLVAAGIPTKLVSMPCQDVFLQQSQDYQAEILPGNIPTLSVEASATHGWHRFSHAQIGMDNLFGASGKGNKLYDHFGFTPDNIFTKGKQLVDFYKDGDNTTPVPSLRNVPVFAPFAKPLH